MVACTVMVVVWKLERKEGPIEVRRAGRSIRLYTGGAFHSQYNPGRLLPGGVWDLLALPSLMLPGGRSPKTALMLGVGGGAAMRLLERLHPALAQRGIERDPAHLEVARRWFGCADMDLIEADATAWVHRDRRRYHLVIDDLFVHGTGDPIREGKSNASDWLAQVTRRVSRHGILIRNHLSPAEARAEVDANRDAFGREFASALMFTRPHYENGILALFRDPVRARDARRRAVEAIRTHDAASARQLSFRCRQLF